MASRAIEAFERALMFELSPETVDYLIPQKKRIARSLEWLAPHVQEQSRILELGGGLFSHIFRSIYPEIAAQDTNSDLRYPLQIPPDRFDLVVNTELIEHLKDREEADVDQFDLSGFHNVLSEAYRVLKASGMMFVTTPNACSTGSLYRLLMGWPPLYYYHHVREYTVHELAKFLQEHGFTIERIETLDVYDDLPSDRVAEVSALLAQNGYSLEHRGGCSFILARK
jgi:hypothetical protein